jgi:hypothetical protein
MALASGSLDSMLKPAIAAGEITGKEAAEVLRAAVVDHIAAEAIEVAGSRGAWR